MADTDTTNTTPTNPETTLTIPDISTQPPVADPAPGVDPDDQFMTMFRDKTKDKYSAKPKEGEDPPEPTGDPTPPEPAKPDDNKDIPIDPLATHTAKPKKTKEENMKSLRNSLKESRTTIDDLTAKLETSESKIKDIPAIETLQTTVEEKDKRIEQLQKYEDLLGLYETEGHKEKYYDGVNSLVADATNIAKEYEVPAEVISDAMKLTNRKELNAHLLQYFDQISIGDVRPLIIEAQKLMVERVEVEKNPAKTKEQLIAMMRDKNVNSKSQAKDTITNTTASAWEDIVTLYSATKGTKILNTIAGNEEHNKQRNTLLEKSSNEFGKAVTALVDNGLTTMPDGLAKALAARFQLGEVAAHVIAENESLVSEVTALQKELKNLSGYTRPLSNGSNVTTPNVPSSSEPPTGTHEIATHVMTTAMEKIAAQKEN